MDKKRYDQLLKQRGKQEYQDWRTAVLARDGNKCQYPGCNKTDKLQVHHIRRYTDAKHLKTDIRNGITLCIDCHRKVTGREDMYALLFLNIVLSYEQKK